MAQETPELYQFYNDKYDYQALRKAYDEGINDYLSTLKRGEKDRDEFINAGNALMEGLRTGRVSWGDGRFNDSQGEYTNSTSKNKNKDYMGLMANYIYNLMGGQPKYEAPEDKNKIKWDNGKGLVTAFYKDTFNSDTPNWKVWEDLDTTETGTTGRQKMFMSWLKDQTTKADRYSDLGEADLNNIYQKFGNLLNDGTIDPGDSLALNRYGFDVSTLFRDLNAKPAEQPQTPEQQAAEEQKAKQENLKAAVTEANTLFPKLTSANIQDLNGDSLTPEAWQLISNNFSRNSDAGLITLINQSIANRNLTFQAKYKGRVLGVPHAAGLGTALKTAKYRGLLKSIDSAHPNLYLLPWTFNKERFSYYVWDTDTNRLIETSGHDLPIGQEQIKKYFTDKGLGNQESEDLFASYHVKLENGGLLKLKTGGTANWYSALIDYDPTLYKTEWDSKLYNSDFGADAETGWNAWVSNQNGQGTGRYQMTTGYGDTYNRGYVKNIETDPLYQAQTSAFIDETTGQLTPLGEKWAHATDALLPSDSKARFYNADGKLNTSWTVTNKDAYGRGEGTKTYNNVVDYLKHVRTDEILGSRHNGFRKYGKRYFYTDSDGKQHWVNPEDISKYTVSKDPTKQGWDKDTYWEDYELTGLADGQNGDQNGNQGDGSKKSGVNPVDIPFELKYQNANKFLSLLPWGMRATALINTNRSNDKYLPHHIPPVLQSKNWQAQVRGDWASRVQGQQNYAQTMNLASRNQTADAQVNAAIDLDSHFRGLQEVWKGLLADNQKMDQTKQQADQLGWKSMENRVDTRNQNEVARVQTINDNQDMLAQEKAQNAKNVSNYINGTADYVEGLLADRESRQYQNAISNLSLADYNARQKFEQQYLASHPNATIESMAADPEYKDAYRTFDLYKLQQQNNILNGRYPVFRNKFNTTTINKYYA